MSGTAYIDPCTRIIAFWSPKCACTSVDHWFAKGVLALNPAFKNHIDSELRKHGKNEEGSPRAFLAAYGFKYNSAQSMRHAQSGDYFIVHFTRHPALRLVSAYLNKFVVFKGRLLNTFESLEPFAKDVVKQIYRNNGWDGSTYGGIRFIDLVNYLETVIGNPHQNIHVDHHWDTQLPRHILRTVHIKPNYVVHAEKFYTEIENLNRALSIGFVPATFNTTTFVASETCAHDLSEKWSHELSSMNIKVTAANLLNDDILNKIGRIYEVDYQYFGYNPSNLIYTPDEEISQLPSSEKRPTFSPAR